MDEELSVTNWIPGVAGGGGVFSRRPSRASLCLLLLLLPWLAGGCSLVYGVDDAGDPLPLALKIKVLLIWLGAASVLFFLTVFNLVQTFASGSAKETWAKILVNGLAFLLLFWFWSTYKIDHTPGFRAFLTAPSPELASGQMLQGAASALLMFATLFVLEALADLTHGKSFLQALTVFASSIVIYLILPLTPMMAEPLELVPTRLYHISTGIVLGGVLYLICLLFRLATGKPVPNLPHS